jgi:hypothetical protein
MPRARRDRTKGSQAVRVAIRAVSTLVPALVVVAACAGAAIAAPSSPSSTAAASSFCSASRSVAHDIVNSTSVSNGQVNPANLKTTYLKIQAAGPKLLKAAPKKVKTDLRPVLSFVNVIVADFKSVNWSPTALIQRYGTALVPRAQAVAPHVKRLKVYFHKTCKLNV